MPWSEIASGKYQRGIGENEAFIKLIGDPGHPSGREHWAINSIATFEPSESLAQEDLSTLFRNAWKNLRFQHPSIAARAIDDTTLEYAVPDSTALDQWAAKTFRVVEDSAADELIPSLKPSPYATLIFLPTSNEVLGRTAHWRTDGLGVLHLLDAFLTLVTSSSLPDPAGLAWGEEPARLAPAVEDAANIPLEPSPAQRVLARRYVETFYQAAGALGIPYKGTPSTLPRGTRSARLAFGTADTAAVICACKARGLSITAAVHASIAAANWALAAPDRKTRHYTSTVRFGLRLYLPERYRGQAYAAGLYTTGWMVTVEAGKHWEENAERYGTEYRSGLCEEYVEAHREYARGLGELIRNMPAGGDDPPSEVDISSIGVAEGFVERAKGTKDRGLKVQSVSVGVEILTRQCVCFVWTFREILNLNLVYNESFHDKEDMSTFVRMVKEILMRELGIQG